MATSEIESLEELRDVLGQGRALGGLRLQGLDLTGPEGQQLLAHGCRGLVVLGGTLPPELDHDLRVQGATIFPSDPDAPVDPYRAHPYSPAELYAGLHTGGYASTPDAATYAWSQQAHLNSDVFVTLLRAIHDHSMTDAIDDLLDSREVIGVMGGHALERGTSAYAEAAHMAHHLATSGLTILTGGGPGAMEAANLGALCRTTDALDQALESLRAVPTFRPSIDRWATLAWDVRDQVAPHEIPPAEVRSVGIPTWFYGHEPPNLFASCIAKFFSNALREDLLTQRCTAGLIVLPGAAGTAQEIFQAITPLYYAPEGSPLPPLVLVGTQHWQHDVPVWPAVQGLANDRRMASAVHLVDTPADAARVLLADR
ncbi:LOG family protein [Demetria terragena]|uniref:LOG family protein n=1 Tax=Demetria terragena TaxID=63959 RepID=UPI000361EA14|nr:LOG family protein [Demetria terragena]